MRKVEATFPNSKFNPFDPVRLRNGGEVGSLRIILDGRIYCIRGKREGSNEERSWTIDGRRYMSSEEDTFDLVNYDPDEEAEPPRRLEGDLDVFDGDGKVVARIHINVLEGEGL